MVFTGKCTDLGRFPLRKGVTLGFPHHPRIVVSVRPPSTTVLPVRALPLPSYPPRGSVGQDSSTGPRLPGTGSRSTRNFGPRGTESRRRSGLDPGLSGGLSDLSVVRRPWEHLGRSTPPFPGERVYSRGEGRTGPGTRTRQSTSTSTFRRPKLYSPLCNTMNLVPLHRTPWHLSRPVDLVCLGLRPRQRTTHWYPVKEL